MKRRYLMNMVSCLMLVIAVQRGFAATTVQLEDLTLDNAVARAERLHPQIAEARALVDAAAGRAEQVGTLPNPELIVGALQLPLESGASEQREFVAGIAQPIPLTGRLGKAREAEMFEREVRLRGLEVVSRQLRRRVHAAFAAALYQGQAFEARSQISSGFKQMTAIMAARIEAGDAVPGDLAQVEMELLRASVELERSRALRDQSFTVLAKAMGDASLKIAGLSGELDETFEIPVLETLSTDLVSQPEILLAEASLRASLARIELARTERIPDVRVEALYHRLESSEEDTIDIGISIPLPLFNRNQGRLREARAVAEAAQARSQMTANELGARLQTAYGQLTAALSNCRTFKSNILPHADKVLRAAEARYEAGDISLVELLPIRRDLAAVHLGYLESLRDVLLAWSTVKGFQ